MYLEKLEIQGFKSFANSTTFIFNRELTTVVGPNGSGKSNIADAVRWVLGEQSVKTLRGKKSEDVIFAGSDTKARLGFARVDLYLNNKDGLANIDFEQVILSRSIDRKGDSEYLINNNKVRLLDIQLLLAQANFGQKTYSVIGQGMIDSILTNSAAERKEFFDEATGVRQFQIKKDQAANKLGHAKDNLEQTKQILTELEPRLRSLTRQVKKLEKRGQLEKELHDLQTNYYSFLSNNLDQELNKTKDKFKTKQEQVAGLNQQLVELQTKLDKHEQVDSRQDKFQTLQVKLQQAQNELNSLVKEKTVLEGKADLKLMSGGKSDLVWLKNRQQALINNLNKNKLFSEAHKKELADKQGIVVNLEKQQQEILAQFKNLEDNLQGSQSFSWDDLSTELETIVGRQETLEKQIIDLESIDDLSHLKLTFQELTKATKILRDKIKQSPADKKINWQIEFNKLLSSKDNLVAEINEAKTKVVILQQKLEQNQNQIDQDQSELDKLSIELKSVDKALGQSELQQALEAAQKKIATQQTAVQIVETEIQDFNNQEEAVKVSLVADQKNFRQLQHDFNIKNNELNEVKVSLARLETRQEDLNKEISEEFSGLKTVEVKEIELEASRQRIHNLRNQLGTIGAIDESIISEYKEVDERYQFLKQQSEDLDEAIIHLEKIIKDLDASISEQFDTSFKNINQLFSKYFKKLFSGGKAQLILDIKEVPINKKIEVETEEGEEEEVAASDEKVATKKQYGIEILATPPGKKLSSINMLSGGEKAMTSIALICAIIANNPSPFVVLDEVDAALDEANSIRFAEILQELSDKTQFIAITHNRATMHQAKIIYGITMGDDGISNLLSMNFEEADEIAS
jgi:chromosome segregation protein